MGPHRQQYRLNLPSQRAQAGITAVGFLILASLVGVVGLGAIKVVPMYLSNMRLSSVLDDVEREFSAGVKNPAAIRTELTKRFAVEGVRVPRENVSITQGRNTFQVRIQMENRATYIGDVFLVMAFDKQVEISR